jgi:hypothetical protein
MLLRPSICCCLAFLGLHHDCNTHVSGWMRQCVPLVDEPITWLAGWCCFCCFCCLSAPSSTTQVLQLLCHKAGSATQIHVVVSLLKNKPNVYVAYLYASPAAGTAPQLVLTTLRSNPACDVMIVQKQHFSRSLSRGYEKTEPILIQTTNSSIATYIGALYSIRCGVIPLEVQIQRLCVCVACTLVHYARSRRFSFQLDSLAVEQCNALADAVRSCVVMLVTNAVRILGRHHASS